MPERSHAVVFLRGDPVAGSDQALIFPPQDAINGPERAAAEADPCGPG